MKIKVEKTARVEPVKTISYQDVILNGGIYKFWDLARNNVHERVVVLANGLALYVNTETHSVEQLDEMCWRSHFFVSCPDETITISFSNT